MRRSILLGFLLLLTFDTGGQVGMKLAADRTSTGEGDFATWLERIATEPIIYGVLLCYLGSFLTYVSLLKYAPVGPAYAAAHGHVVTVMIFSMLFLGERLNLLQAAGVLAIIMGIWILAVTETRAASISAARIPD